MSYLGLALVAEGPSDYRFLPSLLHRLTEDVCLRHGSGVVEVGEVIPLYPRSAAGSNRAAQVLEAARAAAGSYHVLFLHTDGDGDYEAALEERFRPWTRALDGLGRQGERNVAVVPVREMEAWAVCDGNALRVVLGSSLSDADLGIPSGPRDVERLSDPKKTLDKAYRRVVRPRRPRRAASELLEAIAERVRLEVLRQVPAFSRLERDLRTALQELRYVA